MKNRKDLYMLSFKKYCINGKENFKIIKKFVVDHENSTRSHQRDLE
jgi:hypothetical protein